MQCPHCLQDSTPDGGHMEYDTFVKTIEFGLNIFSSIYNISGGEPTENPELLKMCKTFDGISRNFGGVLSFVLASNGMWLKDKGKTEMVKEILSLPSCQGMQVYSNEKYYKEHGWLLRNIRQFDKFTKVIVDTSPIKSMQDLGRARTCETAQKQVRDNRFYMSCLNSILVAKQVGDPKRWGAGLQSSFHICKPLVDYKGNVHLSESWLCPSVGNVNTQDVQTIWANIKKAEPCGNCAGCRKFLASKDPKIVEARKLIYSI